MRHQIFPHLPRNGGLIAATVHLKDAVADTADGSEANRADTGHNRPGIAASMPADASFLDSLTAKNLDVGNKVNRMLHGDFGGLAKAIRQARRAHGETEGWVRVRGLLLFYELIHTTLLPQDPWESYDPTNVLRTVGVCTEKDLLEYFLWISGTPSPKNAI